LNVIYNQECTTAYGDLGETLDPGYIADANTSFGLYRLDDERGGWIVT